MHEDSSVCGLPFTVPFIRWADYADIDPARPMASRRIYDHEFVYVIAGGGEISIAGCVYPALPDSLFLIQPRVWHHFRAGGSEPLQLLGIHFDWLARHDTLRFPVFRPADEPVDHDLFREPREVPHWRLESTPCLPLQGRPRVRRLLEQVVEEYARADEEARTSAGALLAAAIGQMSRESRMLEQLRKNTAIGADAVRRVQRARELLEDSREFSINEVAATVGWSADHLRRMCRAVLDTPPARVQSAARLRRAKDLLRAENLPMSEIAARCGFADASHFTRAFRQENGLTPRQFLTMVKKR